MFQFRTDLALEAHELYSKDKNIADGIQVGSYKNDGITVTEIRITNKSGEKLLGKPIGSYVTIDAPNLLYSSSDYKNACRILADELKKIYPIGDDTSILAVCLGNRDITADALGVNVFKNLMVTRHIKKYIPEHTDNSIRSVSAVAPGVIGTTGIETADIIKGIVSETKPDVIFAVDSLAARSLDRISTTIQIADTGIAPGAGIGNFTAALNEETLGAKVIAIGVPTVVDAVTIVNDSIGMLSGMMKNKITESEMLSETQLRKISDMVEKSISKNIGSLIVTPKEIDRIIQKVSKTVANGINLAVHSNLSLEDIDGYIN
ncbi:MAG: GPR endopeptidase [Oscillospiraceae bacterium]|nr:GPR endopeptidase [Oscillospiraceae bacterium]